MVGNGGWSYTLNHQKKISASDKVAALNAPSDILKDTSRQLIFDGRTPCEELTKEYQLATIAGCFKLKWRLILNKDPKTLEPTTYSINLTNSRGDQITGKWKMIKGSHANPDLILYQLDPDKSGQSISLLAADKNVLFFLHKTIRYLKVMPTLVIH